MAGYSGGAAILSQSHAPAAPKTTPNKFSAVSKPVSKPAKAAAGARAKAKAAGPPNPLAPLKPGQIQKQAVGTINKAYGGQFASLNTQTSQAQNLYKTQQADDTAFNRWLTSNAQAMQTKTDTVNQALLGVMTHIQDTQSQALGAQPAQLAGQIAPGAADSQQTLQSGLGALTKPSTDTANLHAAAAAEGLVRGVAQGDAVARGGGDIATARLNQAHQSEMDNLNKTLTAIAGERTKLLAARTGDIAKEIARLNGIEISKAQYNQNQRMLGQEISIKQQTANIGAANARTNATNAITRALAAQETARHNTNMEKINSAHYASQAGHDAAVLAEQTRHNGVMEAISQQNANTSTSRAAAAGATAAAKAAKPGTPTQQAALRAKIGQVRQMLIWDIEQYHKGDPNALSLAWHDLQNGNFMAAKYGHRNAAGVWIPGPRVPVNQDIGIINAATNTLTQYGAQGLTPGDVAWLQGTGRLSNVKGFYPIKGEPNQGQGQY